MPFCEKCGTKVLKGNRFCDNCGAPLDEEAVSPQPVPPTSQGTNVPSAPPKSTPIPQIYIAVGIAVVVIIIALVLASGAMSGSSNHVVTPTVPVTPAKQGTTISNPTPKTTVSSSKDPIVGIWRHCGEYCNSMKDTFQFTPDGTFTKSSIYYESSDIGTGTWSPIGGNSYKCVYSSGIPFTIRYDQAKNAIYEPGSPNVLFTPVH